MIPAGKKRNNITVHRMKFIKGEHVQEANPEQEIKVLEWLLTELEKKEDYETAAIAHYRIEALKQELTNK
jgi:protein-arginine kinase activator protein McsA